MVLILKNEKHKRAEELGKIRSRVQMLFKIDFYQNINFSINSTLHLIYHLIRNLKYCCLWDLFCQPFPELQDSGGQEIRSLLSVFSPNMDRYRKGFPLLPMYHASCLKCCTM